MASNLIAIASNLEALASNLIDPFHNFVGTHVVLAEGGVLKRVLDCEGCNGCCG